MKTWYRVEHKQTGNGLWYTLDGQFSGLIHSEEFSFLSNRDLQMPFSDSISGYLSVTPTLEDLFNWFNKEDLTRLKPYGYVVAVYECEDAKHTGVHYVINQSKAKRKNFIEI